MINSMQEIRNYINKTIDTCEVFSSDEHDFGSLCDCFFCCINQRFHCELLCIAPDKDLLTDDAKNNIERALYALVVTDYEGDIYCPDSLSSGQSQRMRKQKLMPHIFEKKDDESVFYFYDLEQAHKVITGLFTEIYKVNGV